MTAPCTSWAHPNRKAYTSWDLHANPHLVRFPAVSIFTPAASTLLWKPPPTLRFLLHCFFEPCSLTWWSQELGATPSTLPTTASSFTFCPVLSLSQDLLLAYELLTNRSLFPHPRSAVGKTASSPGLDDLFWLPCTAHWKLPPTSNPPGTPCHPLAILVKL